MTREVFYESKKVKVYRDGDTYEIYKVSARNWDGIYSVDLNYYATITPIYKRDWLGRTETWPRWNRSNDPNYAHEMVLLLIKDCEV